MVFVSSSTPFFHAADLVERIQIKNSNWFPKACWSAK